MNEPRLIEALHDKNVNLDVLDLLGAVVVYVDNNNAMRVDLLYRLKDGREYWWGVEGQP